MANNEALLAILLIAGFISIPGEAVAQVQETGGKLCHNKIDDDGDGLIDGADPDCSKDGGGDTDPLPTDMPIVYERVRFKSHPKHAGSRLEVSNIDGSQQEIILEGSDRDSVFDPSWSPTGNWLVFGGSEGLHVVKEDGTGLSAIPGTADANSPAWSPNGEWIVFTLPDPPDDDGIWLVQVLDVSTGSFAPPFPLSTYSGENPTWAPDSLRIAVGNHDPTLGYLLTVLDLDFGGVPSVDATNSYRFPFSSGLASNIFSTWAKADEHSSWIAMVGPHAPNDPDATPTWTDLYFVDLAEPEPNNCVFDRNDGVFDCGAVVNLTTGLCCKLNNPNWSGDDLATTEVDETDTRIVLDSAGALTIPVVFTESPDDLEWVPVAPFEGSYDGGNHPDWKREYGSPPPE